MDRFDEDIKLRLLSCDPRRISGALRELNERMKWGGQTDIPSFGVELLDCFPDNVPEETQLDFVSVVNRYRRFVPPKTARERIAAMVAVVLRYAERYVAFEVALKLKIAPDPTEAVEVAIDEMLRHGIPSDRNLAGAKFLVSRLLDSKQPVRRITLTKLREWSSLPRWMDVLEYVKPQLESDEMEALRTSADQ